MSYTDKDYINAIKFALNLPARDMPLSYSYKEEKDIYKVTWMDRSWYTFRLEGFYVRSCLNWKGIRQWAENIQLS